MHHSIKVLAAAAALSFGLASAAQAGNIVEESSPVYWGSTGAFADLVLRLSASAKAPVSMQFRILDISGAPTTQLINQCTNASPFKQGGDTVVGYTVNPGGWCYYRVPVTGSSIAAHAMLTDSTANNTNISQFVRGSLEVRDGSNNVLTHVEVR